jgi:sulfide:quinone oxidoreductase
MTRTLILGGGFGGITVATELRRHLGDDHEIVLVDRREQFAMGLRKLWALVGIGSYEEGSRPRQRLSQHGVRFLHRQVTNIDPVKRRVATDRETLEGDYLVVALGAEPRPDLVPGLAEHAYNAWDEGAVPGLATAIGRFTGGRIAIVIAGVPYTCPPAPFECSMLLDDHLRERGLRDRTEITVATLQPMLLPNAGKEGSAWLADQLGARGIEFHVKRRVERVEPGHIVFTDGDLESDVVIGVPPHRVPAVVTASGLTGDGEWIAVDPATLETDHENVFAVGDVTQIKLANGLPLPKAGVMAELEGQRVAAAIAADVRGEASPRAFDGRGYCFIEMGKTKATLVEGDFFATPEPRIALKDVSAEYAAQKRQFEAERLARWFGK